MKAKSKKAITTYKEQLSAQDILIENLKMQLELREQENEALRQSNDDLAQ